MFSNTVFNVGLALLLRLLSNAKRRTPTPAAQKGIFEIKVPSLAFYKGRWSFS